MKYAMRKSYASILFAVICNICNSECGAGENALIRETVYDPVEINYKYGSSDIFHGMLDEGSRFITFGIDCQSAGMNYSLVYDKEMQCYFMRTIFLYGNDASSWTDIGMTGKINVLDLTASKNKPHHLYFNNANKSWERAFYPSFIDGSLPVYGNQDILTMTGYSPSALQMMRYIYNGLVDLDGKKYFYDLVLDNWQNTSLPNKSIKLCNRQKETNKNIYIKDHMPISIKSWNGVKMINAEYPHIYINQYKYRMNHAKSYFVYELLVLPINDKVLWAADANSLEYLGICWITGDTRNANHPISYVSYGNNGRFTLIRNMDRAFSLTSNIELKEINIPLNNRDSYKDFSSNNYWIGILHMLVDGKE